MADPKNRHILPCHLHFHRLVLVSVSGCTARCTRNHHPTNFPLQNMAGQPTLISGGLVRLGGGKLTSHDLYISLCFDIPSNSPPFPPTSIPSKLTWNDPSLPSSVSSLFWTMAPWKQRQLFQPHGGDSKASQLPFPPGPIEKAYCIHLPNGTGIWTSGLSKWTLKETINSSKRSRRCTQNIESAVWVKPMYTPEV